MPKPTTVELPAPIFLPFFPTDADPTVPYPFVVMVSLITFVPM
jgi:hypothetical protein